MSYAIEVSDTGRVMAAVAGSINRLKATSRDIAEEGAKAGYEAMFETIPEDKGNLKRRLFWDHAVWHPGGAGGGGYWEAEAGLARAEVREGVDIGELIIQGTGLYGPRHTKIVPKAGKTLPIGIGGPSVVFRQSQKGMRPQVGWIIAGQMAASASVKEGVETIDSMIFGAGHSSPLSRLL